MTTPRAWAGLLLGLAACVLLGACSDDPAKVSTKASAPSPTVVNPAEAEIPYGLVGPGEPCMEAVHAETIADLEHGKQIWSPVGEALTDAWTCADTPVLMYDDVQISYEGGWSNVAIPAKWHALANEHGGRVEEISGVPAYIADESPNREVLMVADGQLVRLLAKGDVPIDRLISLATAIDLPE